MGCDVVSDIAEGERAANRYLDVEDKMKTVMKELDTNEDAEISLTEFECILKRKDIWCLLEDIDVDPMGFLDFGEIYFFDDEKPVNLKFDEFMTMIMDLREGNQATVKSLLNMWLKVKQKLSMNYEAIHDLQIETEAAEVAFDKKLGEINSAVSDV